MSRRREHSNEASEEVERERAVAVLRDLVEASERDGGANPAEDVRKRVLKRVERIAMKRE